MYIVYEEKEIKQLQLKYLLLPMDTIKISSDKIVTAHCVIDTNHVMLHEMSSLDDIEELHLAMIEDYKSQAWDECIAKIAKLTGIFKGELDTFYNNINERISQLRDTELTSTWTGIIDRYHADDKLKVS